MKGSVRKKGNNWYYSFDVSKKGEKRKRIERLGGKTKREAESALRKAIEDFEAEKIKEQDVTLYKLTLIRIENFEKIKTKSTTLAAKLYRMELFNYKKILDISIYDPEMQMKLQNHINELSRKHKYSMLQKMLSDANSALNYGLNFLNLQTPYRLKQIFIPNKNVRKKQVSFSKKTIQDMIDKSNYNIKILLYVMIETACRIGEALSIEEKNIDFEKRIIFIERTSVRFPKDCKRYYGKPKTESSERIVRISENLCNLLKEYLKIRKVKPCFLITHGDYASLSFTKGQKFDPILRNKIGNPWSYWSVRKALCKIGLNLDIKIQSHNFRRTNASLLLENGATLEEIRIRLGHKNLLTTQRYIQSTQNTTKRIDELLEKIKI